MQTRLNDGKPFPLSQWPAGCGRGAAGRAGGAGAANLRIPSGSPAPRRVLVSPDLTAALIVPPPGGNGRAEAEFPNWLAGMWHPRAPAVSVAPDNPSVPGATPMGC